VGEKRVVRAEFGLLIFEERRDPVRVVSVNPGGEADESEEIPFVFDLFNR
jgi:hypothetical protein